MMTHEYAVENMTPIRFTPDIERVYANHLLARFGPLARLGYGIGIASFAGYGLWNLMLDSDALAKTAPIRAAVVLHFALCIGVSFLPTIRTSPKLWFYFGIYV